MLKKQAEAEGKLAELRDNIAFMIGDVNIGANAFAYYKFDDKLAIEFNSREVIVNFF